MVAVNYVGDMYDGAFGDKLCIDGGLQMLLRVRCNHSFGASTCKKLNMFNFLPKTEHRSNIACIHTSDIWMDSIFLFGHLSHQMNLWRNG